MLNLNDEKSAPKVVQTGECWFCKQIKPLTETMYVPFNFLTDKITRDNNTGDIIKHWKTDESRIPRDFLMEKNALTLIPKSRNRYNELETKWKYKIVNVPRCEDCYRVHQNFFKIYKLVKLLLIAAFAVGIGLITWNAYKVSGSMPGMLLLVISSLIFFLALKVLGRYINILINYTANSLGYNTERRCQKFPEVLGVVEQGWKLGENPDVTPESYSI